MNVTIFNNPQFGEIRTAGTPSEPLFCLADVCRVLDLQVSPTKNRLRKDGVNSIKVIDNLGRSQQALFISVQNLYKVIMRSDKPQAEPFQDWVCGDVLPTIRRTGGYIKTTEEMTDTEILAKAMLVAQNTIEKRNERIAQLEAENDGQKQLIAQMKKGNDYLNAILASKGTITMTQIAADYGMSAQAMNRRLKDMRIQRRVNGQWILYSGYMAKGFVHSRTISFTRASGRQDTRMQTEWTQRGRLFLYDALKEIGILPLIERQN